MEMRNRTQLRLHLLEWLSRGGCTLTVWLAFTVGSITSPVLATSNDNPARDEFSVQVVSSAPYQVTGGHARLHVEVPRTVPLHHVEVWVNGIDQRAHFNILAGTARTLTGVIDGLKVGKNHLQVKANGQGKGRPVPVDITLTNYPITGPIFSGPHQHPFVCTTMSEGLGQPIPDHPTTGTQVFDVSGKVIGYSRDCSIATQVVFTYRTTTNQWKDYDLTKPRPADMAQTTTIDGQRVDFIVRWERGTINRFIYSIAMLAPFDDSAWELNRDAWNKRVIYRFDGGVGIGHSQGRTSTSAMLYDIGLARGYAILYSSGTRTGTHTTTCSSAARPP
jgi:hypothetical protein